MVATAFPAATKAGVEMLRRGGNAVDAACASALALGVCEPQASGLGGECKALVHVDGKTFTVDGSSRAPAAIDLTAPGQDALSVGYGGASVPSTLAVLGHLQRRYGRLSWKEILAPSVLIAREGYAITKLQHDLQVRELAFFKQVPSLSGSRYFLKPGSTPYEPGEVFTQPELADLLGAIAELGPEHFYTGEPARRVDEDMRVNGGYLRYEDLADIPWPVERPALVGEYRGRRIATMPPSSGGRMLLFALRALQRLPSSLLYERSPESCELLAELFKATLLANETSLPDPDTYSPGVDPMVNGLGVGEALAMPPLSAYGETPGETTHLSVMDKDGNAVGITQSINLVYGGKAAADGLGFLYNNYLIDMNREDPGHPHYLKPKGRSCSFVAPTLVFDGDEPWILTGSPGSLRIFTTVVQFLSNVMDRDMTIYEAMTEPRLHCTSTGLVSLEAERFRPGVLAHLERRGFELDRRDSWTFYLGAVHAILRSRSGHGFQGVAEIRRDGTAEGI